MLGGMQNPETSNDLWASGPARPSAPGDKVHIWNAKLDRPDWPTPDRLPDGERERAAAILSPESAARWSAAHWALRTVLGRYLGEDPGMIELQPGALGKPELCEPSPLAFNLSHSGALALIAVADGREVGVDVERVEPRRDFLALAERSFDPTVVAAIRVAPPARQQDVFYAAWVQHEAQAKCDGGGLGARRRETVMATATVEVGPGYAAALAVAGPEVPRLHEWSIGPPSARVRR
jgi:4'-phosphopantetheinyl transferase